MSYDIQCCSEMEEHVLDGNMICILRNIPFTQERTEPTAYIQSDWGHGGSSVIKFCPFCGKEIEIQRSVPNIKLSPADSDS